MAFGENSIPSANTKRMRPQAMRCVASNAGMRTGNTSSATPAATAMIKATLRTQRKALKAKMRMIMILNNDVYC